SRGVDRQRVIPGGDLREFVGPIRAARCAACGARSFIHNGHPSTRHRRARCVQHASTQSGECLSAHRDGQRHEEQNEFRNRMAPTWRGVSDVSIATIILCVQGALKEDRIWSRTFSWPESYALFRAYVKINLFG